MNIFNTILNIFRKKAKRLEQVKEVLKKEPTHSFRCFNPTRTLTYGKIYYGYTIDVHRNNDIETYAIILNDNNQKIMVLAKDRLHTIGLLT